MADTIRYSKRNLDARYRASHQTVGFEEPRGREGSYFGRRSEEFRHLCSRVTMEGGSGLLLHRGQLELLLC